MTPEERADRDMAEVPTLTNLVVGYALERGWKVRRERQGKAGWSLGSGFPDIFAVRGNESLFAELKREGLTLEPRQIEWMNALIEAGQRHYVWRPSDWRTGRIQEILA